MELDLSRYKKPSRDYVLSLRVDRESEQLLKEIKKINTVDIMQMCRDTIKHILKQTHTRIIERQETLSKGLEQCDEKAPQ